MLTGNGCVHNSVLPGEVCIIWFFRVCRFAFVEFSSPNSVPIALQYNGAMFGDRPIKLVLFIMVHLQIIPLKGREEARVIVM